MNDARDGWGFQQRPRSGHSNDAFDWSTIKRRPAHSESDRNVPAIEPIDRAPSAIPHCTSRRPCGGRGGDVRFEAAAAACGIVIRGTTQQRLALARSSAPADSAQTLLRWVAPRPRRLGLAGRLQRGLSASTTTLHCELFGLLVLASSFWVVSVKMIDQFSLFMFGYTGCSCRAFVFTHITCTYSWAHPIHARRKKEACSFPRQSATHILSI